jgi:recombination DNA repair RAD52 pathway protein
MPFTEEQNKKLMAPLHPDAVKPPAPGRFGDYIEGWHAIAEANRIFGFGNWTRELKTSEMVNGEKIMMGPKTNQYEGWSVSYIATVRVTVLAMNDKVVVREGTGAGHGKDRDLGLAHESAIKEAETDAMKRAMMTFGNPFGLALYDKEKKNVSAIDQDGVTQFMQDLNATADIAALDALMAMDETIEMADALRKEDPGEYRTVVAMISAKRRELKMAEAIAGSPETVKGESE